MIEIYVFLLGLIFGSFLGALTYRFPQNISISSGRSFCPSCKKQIYWYDNIPLLSYILLRGKCRRCKKSISSRYPLIEFFTALTLLFIFLRREQIIASLPFLDNLGLLSIPFLFFIALILIAIFVVDLEHQIIPDTFIFVGIGGTILAFLLTDFQNIYLYLLSGMGSGIFLLTINGLTKGRGMGLGDVKLALLIGALLGPSLSIMWMFVSFVVGGVLGILLILSQNAKLKDKIAFGPFLIAGFFLVLLVGEAIKPLFLYL